LASTTLGAAFALSLWGFAWHMKTSTEDQDIYTTYYNGNTRMWELRFPGSTVRVFAFNEQRGRTLMTSARIWISKTR
jgi:hypothetical protein